MTAFCLSSRHGAIRCAVLLVTGVLLVSCGPGPFAVQERSLPGSSALGANDTFYNGTDPDQWYLRSVRAPEAWGLYASLQQDPVIAGDLSTTTVAVIDTWIDTSHIDLRSVLAGPLVDSVASQFSASQAEHGTHVAALAAGQSNDGVGIAGVAYNRDGMVSAGLLPIRGLETEGNGAISDLLSAITAVSDFQNLTGSRVVVNLSLGSPDEQGPIANLAIQELVSGNALVVAAAGNGIRGGCEGRFGGVNWPANMDEVMAVGSVNFASDRSASERSAFSDYGPEIELMAPGSLLDCTTGVISAVPNGRWALKAGTSMATPLVAGAAATVWSANPRLSASDLRRILHESALDLGPAGRDIEYGYGLLDMEAALRMAVSGQWGRFQGQSGAPSADALQAVEQSPETLSPPGGSTSAVVVLGYPGVDLSAAVASAAATSGLAGDRFAGRELGSLRAGPLLRVGLPADDRSATAFVDALRVHPAVRGLSWDQPISTGR